MKIKTILVILISLPGVLMSQLPEEINIAGFHYLEYGRKLPEDFLSTKVAVFISVPPEDNKQFERGDWKALANRVHPQFKKMGIDAVAYYYMDDLVSGWDPKNAFLTEMNKRRIKNVVLLSQVRSSKSNEADQYVLVITGFGGKNELISDGQKAWKMQRDDLKSILSELGKDVYRDKQPKTNFMIMDIPEFFTTADIIKGKRIPTYSKDLKVDKLVVPLFQKHVLPENIPEGSFNDKITAEIEAYNSLVDQYNVELQAIMETYPLKYAISEKSNDKDLYNEGHDYVLLKIHTTGTTIRELLGFKIDKSETDFITVKPDGIRRLSVNTPVHKYYVKHLYTKDIYVGSKWDADDTWQGALETFIENHLSELKVKRKK